MSEHTSHNGHANNGLNGHSKQTPGQRQAAELAASWRDEARWQGIRRPYSPEDVLRLRGSIQI